MRHYWLLTKKSPVLNTTCSLHMGYTGTMRDINIVELSPHRECPMRFFFQNGLQLCHISKEMHAFWRSNKLFCNRKISAILMIKTWNTIILWRISHARTRRGGGGNRWPGLTLKAIEFDPHPLKMLDPLKRPVHVIFFFFFSYQINLKTCDNI